MRLPALAILGAILLTGCGGGSGDDDDDIDAGGGDATLVFPRNGAALLAARDGDAAWQQLTAGADGTAQLTVLSGRYQVVYVCTNAPGVFVYLQSATPATAPRPPTCVGPTGVIVRGNVLPATAAAQIFIGNSMGQAMPDGSFALITDAVAIDAAALSIDAPVRLAIERDVDASATIELDLASAPALVPTTIIVDGTRGETVLPYVRLYTPHHLRAELAARGGMPYRLPADRLGAGDRQVAGTVIAGTTGSRTIQRAFTDTPPATLTAPPADTFTITPAAVTWQRPWTRVNATLAGGGGLGLTASVTGAYAAAAGAATQLPLVDPTTLPGWMPAWGQLAASVTFAINASLGDEDGDGETAHTNGTTTR